MSLKKPRSQSLWDPCVCRAWAGGGCTSDAGRRNPLLPSPRPGSSRAVHAPSGAQSLEMELECGPGSPRVPPLQLLTWVPPPALSPAGPRGWLALVSLCFLLVIAQSCPTLRNPMDCSPPGSSVHEILPARTLEWDSMTSMIFQGIVPTQGSNPRLLRWQADSFSLYHLGIP